jgi:plastocyanin
LDTDQKFSYTFTKSGTYPYYCLIHPKMEGKIIVQ